MKLIALGLFDKKICFYISIYIFSVLLVKIIDTLIKVIQDENKDYNIFFELIIEYCSNILFIIPECIQRKSNTKTKLVNEKNKEDKEEKYEILVKDNHKKKNKLIKNYIIIIFMLILFLCIVLGCYFIIYWLTRKAKN